MWTLESTYIYVISFLPNLSRCVVCIGIPFLFHCVYVFIMCNCVCPRVCVAYRCGCPLYTRRNGVTLALKLLHCGIIIHTSSPSPPSIPMAICLLTCPTVCVHTCSNCAHRKLCAFDQFEMHASACL